MKISWNRKHFLNLLELKVSLVFMMTLVLLMTLPSTARTATTFGPEQIISLAVDGAQSVFSADIDGDGDLDAVSAALQGGEIAWHENVNGDGSSWTKRVIASLPHGKAAFAIDIDGDGDIDVVSSAGFVSPTAPAIRWHENNGAVPPVWTTHTIQNVWNAGAIWAGDIDGDGDIDVASTDIAQDRVTWHENNGAVPPAWSNHTVTSSMSNAQAVDGADIDGDGDIDLLSATVRAGAENAPDKVSWFENGNSWAEHQISTFGQPTFLPGFESVKAVDIDGDGDTDVLAAGYDVTYGRVWLWKNTPGSPPTWSSSYIKFGPGDAVFTSDLDGDGDPDIITNSRWAAGVTWYENTDATTWTPTTLPASGSIGGRDVFTGDLDGDGDQDILAASSRDDRIAWYENDPAPAADSSDLAITKTAVPNPVETNAQQTFTLDVINNGPDNATGVTVVDTLPAGMTFVSASSGCVEVAGVVTCSIGNLSTSASTSVQIVVAAPASPASLSNTATVAGAEIDPDMNNNSATADIVVVAPAPDSSDLAITKTAAPNPVETNAQQTFTLEVTNNGPDDATGVTVVDNLPAGMTFVSASGGCVEVAGVVTCSIGGLSASASTSVQIVVTAPANPASLSNTASVSGVEDDPDTNNNSATANIVVVAPVPPPSSSDLAITKTVAPNPVDINAQQTFTLEVTNNGPDDATGVTVVDNLPAGMTFVSASGGCVEVAGVVTCSIGGLSASASTSVQIVVTAPANPASLSNTASVSGVEDDPDTNNNDATCDVDVVDEEEPIPTLSEWGTIILMVILALAGVCITRRRQYT